MHDIQIIYIFVLVLKKKKTFFTPQLGGWVILIGYCMFGNASFDIQPLFLGYHYLCGNDQKDAFLNAETSDIY